MIVRNLLEIKGSPREINADHWVSYRLLLKKDGMGFSLHETHVYPGSELRMKYSNHLEAVYCIAGEGEVEDLTSGKVHELIPGTVYALNKHDEHVLRTKTLMRFVCVFNPPCNGEEVHDDSGAYPLVED